MARRSRIRASAIPIAATPCHRDEAADDRHEPAGKLRPDPGADVADERRGQDERHRSGNRHDESGRAQARRGIHEIGSLHYVLNGSRRAHADRVISVRPLPDRGGLAIALAGIDGQRAVPAEAAPPQAAVERPPNRDLVFAPEARAEAGHRHGLRRDQPRQPAVADRAGRADRRPAVLEVRRGARAGRGRDDRPRRSRPSGRQPARSAGRRVLDAALRQRLHALPAGGRQDRVAAQRPVGGTELEAVARQPLRRSGQGRLRSEVDDADPARRDEGDSADPAARRHRDGQADQDSEPAS